MLTSAILGLIIFGFGLIGLTIVGFDIICLIALILGLLMMIPFFTTHFKDIIKLAKEHKQHKKILYGDYKLLKEYKSNVKEVNSIILFYLENENICKIINNFILQNELTIELLEFCNIPLAKVKNKYIMLNVGEFDTSTTYLKIIKQFTPNLVEENQYLCALSYDIMKKDFSKIDTSYENAFSLYQTLCNQKYMTDNDENYKAFWFLLYFFNKKHFASKSKKLYKLLELKSSNSLEDIITKFLDNDYNESSICFNVWALESNKQNLNDLFNIEYYDLKEKILPLIKDIKEKQKINSLLSNKNKQRYSIADIDIMSGPDFERFIAYMFTCMGYKTEHTQISGDQGIDVIAKKGKTTVAIQAKCYSHTVGNHAVMEAYAGAKYYGAERCMVITNNFFTNSARKLAQSNNVVLWDRETLIEKLKEI